MYKKNYKRPYYKKVEHNKLDETKKMVVMSGCSSGIGLKTAEILAQNDFIVFAGCRKLSDKDNLKNLHKNIIPILLDIKNTQSIVKAFNYVSSKTNKIDAIINNAGIVKAGAVEFLNTEEIKQQFEVNVFGAIKLTQKFLPLLKEGKIINTSSMAASGVFPFISPYCASKRVLDIFFNALEIEMQNPKIKVVSIKPGVIKTPLWNKSISDNKEVFETKPNEMITKYKKELDLLEKNALKNNILGSEPQKVAKTILKALKAKNPKASYCVGFDSKLVMFFEKFPEQFKKSIIKSQLKSKLKSI